MRISPAKPYDHRTLMFEAECPPIRVFEETGSGLREVDHSTWKMTGNGFQLTQAPCGPMWAQVEP